MSAAGPTAAWTSEHGEKCLAPNVALRALEVEYEVALVRAEEAEHHGIEVTRRDVPALARLIDLV